MSRLWMAALVMVGGFFSAVPQSVADVPVHDVDIVIQNYHAVNNVVEMVYPVDSPNIVRFVRPANTFQAHFLSAMVNVNGQPCFQSIIGVAGATVTFQVKQDCWNAGLGEIPWHCMFHTGVNGLLRLADTDLAAGRPYTLGALGTTGTGPNTISPAEKVRITANLGDVVLVFQNGALPTGETGRATVRAGAPTDVVVPLGTALQPTTQFLIQPAAGTVNAVGLFQRV